MSAAWLFPGQGSQYVGMGLAWAARVPGARDALAEAGDVLAFDLPGLLAGGPAEVLADTYNQQPAILAASVAVLRAVRADLPAPSRLAGHSLGEYAALVASGALGYADGLRLVRERGRLMRQAGLERPGSMAAVLGLADDVVEAACADIDEVQVANYNAPGQVVISGATGAVQLAVASLMASGATRIVPLPITIAAHSTLMAPAAGAFAAVVSAVPLVDACVPVVGNVDAAPLTRVDDIRAELTGQLTSSVRWTESVREMVRAGVREFYEVGPGTVLSGLVKRILKAEGVEGALVRALGEPD